MATNFAVPGNNVSTTIGAATAGTGLPYVITLAAGGGAKFPTLTGSQKYRVTICQVAFAYSPTATTSNYTVYNADTLSGDTIKLESLSTAEGQTQTDRVYNVGDIVEIRVTAGTLGDIHAAVNALEYNMTPVSVTTTKACSASDYGTTQLCSGTSANYTVTLPAPVAGQIIAFRMAPTLTKLVTITQHASETIDGVASRVMWANETAILGNDGTNWFKIAGKSIPMQCIMYQSDPAFVTVTSGGGFFAVPMKTVSVDNTGLMGDTTNGRVNILRNSYYNVSQISAISMASTTTAGNFQTCLFVGTTDTFNYSNVYVLILATSSNYTAIGSSTVLGTTTAGYFQVKDYLSGTSNNGSTQGSNGVSANSVSVSEVISW